MSTIAATLDDSKGSTLSHASDRKKLVCLFIGLAVLGLALIVPVPAGLKPVAIYTVGVMAATVFWWITEAMPVPVTALMVPVLLHVMGIVPLNKAITQSFGDGMVPFLIGVLVLSVALTQSGLGKRMTYLLLSLSGVKVSRVVGIFLFFSYAVSMFITDVAVVAMMLPITISLLRSANAEPGKSNFGRAMMMAIMFGSTLGGIATPSGVSANIIAIGFLARNAHIDISFLQWTMIATPISLAIAFVAWGLIMRLFKPEFSELPFGKDYITQQLKEMGSWKTTEVSTLIVFLIAIVLWLISEWVKIPIALVSLLLIGLLAFPKYGAISNWRSIETAMEWGALLLVVGGVCLGIACTDSGLAKWAAENLLAPMAALPAQLQPMAVTLLVAVDSLGFSSFGAAASVNIPFVISYAQQHGLPVMTLVLATAFASSTHFILVTESPSFVLPYAYGYFSFKDMFKIGFILTLVSALVIGVGLVLFGMPSGLPLAG